MRPTSRPDTMLLATTRSVPLWVVVSSQSHSKAPISSPVRMRHSLS